MPKFYWADSGISRSDWSTWFNFLWWPFGYQDPISFEKSESIPVEEEHFPFFNSGTPDKVPLGSVYQVENLNGDENVLHDMSWDSSKG